MPLDVTVAGPNANSYASLAEAEAYLISHYVPSVTVAKWNALSDDQKEQLLIRAAQLLDRHVRWGGAVDTDTQALSWPRACAFDRHGRDIESTVVPTFLKEFQIETALWVMNQGGVAPEVGNGEFDSIRVGSLEIDFHEDGASRRSLLPEEVIAALAPMGKYVAQTPGTVRSVSLIRS